jgi:RimJ/RimL family protein N-acetyltransferase
MMNPVLLDFPDRFESERLIIRASRAGDGPALNAGVIESLPELRHWLPWAQHAPSVAESETLARRGHARWILRDDLSLLLFRKDGASEGANDGAIEGEFIGCSGLHRMDWTARTFEIGYWLRTSQCGHGFMTEAVHAITGFAFDVLRARRVEIRADARNVRSWRVAERCGFELEGTLRNESVDADSVSRDLRIYSRIC